MTGSHVSSKQTPDCECPPHLIDVELALPAGQLPVAGGELPDEVMAARKSCCWGHRPRLCLCPSPHITSLSLAPNSAQPSAPGAYASGKAGSLEVQCHLWSKNPTRSRSKEQDPAEWDTFLLGFLFENKNNKRHLGDDWENSNMKQILDGIQELLFDVWGVITTFTVIEKMLLVFRCSQRGI